MRPLALGVVSIAAIVTPLGLYDAIVPLDDPVDQLFKYAPDPSPMGFGTPPRSALGFNRICGDFYYTPCPNSGVIANETREGGQVTVDYPYGYDSTIPQNMTEIFQSGLETMDQTVSSLFDIEYRTYENIVDQDINNGSRYLVGAFRQIETLALNDDVKPIEGLVVDTKSGGIGFRNHTIPEPLTYGASWSEDLLFIEPETQCVDMNTTLDFTISQDRVSNLAITDRGGFVNLNHEYPEFEENDTQANPDLQSRAYMAAWLSNAMTMFYLNVSNPAEPSPEPFTYMDSTVGKRFPLSPPKSMSLYWDAFMTSTKWGSFLNVPSSQGTFARAVDSSSQKDQTDTGESSNPKDTSKPTKTSNTKQTSSPGNSSASGSDIKYPNPFYVNEKNFTFARTYFASYFVSPDSYFAYSF